MSIARKQRQYVIGYVDTWTTDGRLIEPNALTFRPMPLPVLDGEGKRIGIVVRCWVDDIAIMAEVELDEPDCLPGGVKLVPSLDACTVTPHEQGTATVTSATLVGLFATSNPAWGLP